MIYLIAYVVVGILMGVWAVYDEEDDTTLGDFLLILPFLSLLWPILSIALLSDKVVIKGRKSRRKRCKYKKDKGEQL